MRTTHRFVSLALIVAAGATSLGSCAKKWQTGAVVGTAGGAVAGGAIGSATGSTTKGAIAGAVIGGIAGGIIGDQMDRHAAELKQNIRGATVERVGEGIQMLSVFIRTTRSAFRSTSAKPFGFGSGRLGQRHSAPSVLQTVASPHPFHLPVPVKIPVAISTVKPVYTRFF